ncbi:hypothetical protein CTI14_61865, partial [Methylobacterium radiotolerans]
MLQTVRGSLPWMVLRAIFVGRWWTVTSATQSTFRPRIWLAPLIRDRAHLSAVGQPRPTGLWCECVADSQGELALDGPEGDL